MNKIHILVVLLFGFLIAVQAAGVVAQERIGRFFSSPAERKKLNLMQGRQKPTVTPSSRQVQAQPANDAFPEVAAVQGYVVRSDGLVTLWVNNKVIQENSADAEIEFDLLPRDQSAFKKGPYHWQVKVPGSDKNIHLKWGQRYREETERITERNMPENNKQLRLERTGFLDD